MHKKRGDKTRDGFFENDGDLNVDAGLDEQGLNNEAAEEDMDEIGVREVREDFPIHNKWDDEEEII